MQSLQDLARDPLAELNAELVEGVDAPQQALHEHLVLIERDQGAEGRRVEPVEDEQRQRPSALLHLLRRDALAAAAAQESLGLREGVGDRELLVILAAAGVERLGWSGRISEKISTDILLPAVGQGSLAILCREEDDETREFLINMEDRESMLAARAERSLMRTLEGGCQVPIGAHAVVSEKGISLAGCVCSLDGRTLVRDSVSSETHDDPEKLGADLAGKLLENGAREILREIFGKDSR